MIQHALEGLRSFKYAGTCHHQLRNQDGYCERDICIVSGGTMRACCETGMTNDAANGPEPRKQRRYTWPWFVLAAVLLAITLAVLWMSKEVERTRRIRDLNAPASRTDRGATSVQPLEQAS